MKKITILIAEDHQLVREAWEFFFNSDNRFQLIAQCTTGKEAIEKSLQLQPDVVIMDINLPDISGIEATEQILKFLPGSKILGASMHTRPEYVQKIMEKGACGYITKNVSGEEIFKAVLEIHAGRKYICTEISNDN